MSKKNLKYFDPIDAVEVTQGEYTFYLFEMDAKALLGIAYTSPRTRYRKTGIQRGLDKKRLKDIGQYIREEGKGRGPGIFPNSIIVSFSKDAYFQDGKIHIPNREAGEAFILDGQHRLFAFDPDWSGEVTFDLVVSGYVDLPDEMKAYIFRTINEKQRKINPSLVYDLIPMLRKEWVEFHDLRAQFLVGELNSDPDSPWYDGISMLGGRKRTITQASFITGIKRLLKKGQVFAEGEEDFFEQIIQRDLLFEYFKAIREVCSEAWMKRQYILCKNTGVSATLNLLTYIVKDMKSKEKNLTDEKGLLLTKDDFIPYVAKIHPFSFSSKDYGKIYLGSAGIRSLTEELRQMIFEQ